MLRDMEYLSVFCMNAEKYGPEKTPYFDTFHAVLVVLDYFDALEEVFISLKDLKDNVTVN